MFRKFSIAASAIAMLAMLPGGVSAMSLDHAVRMAVDSNPEIGQAIANREAIEFELRQGRGLFLPRVDLEGSLGAENRNSPSTRNKSDGISGNSDADHVFFRKEGSVIIRQMLFDGFEASSEVDRQASRVDGASYRVLERSEYVALAVIREYLDILRLGRIVAAAERNVAYHNRLLGQIGRGTSGGSLSIADSQQAQERVFAAKANLAETTEEYKAAQSRFLRLVGMPVGKVSNPGSIAKFLPRNLDAAIGMARKNNPSIKIAMADIDAATALVRKAESAYYPKFDLEGRARVGDDLDGIRGHDNDLQGNVVMSWNVFNGGIDSANKQEQIRRVDEQRMKLHQVSREVEEAVRLSWDRRIYQAQRLAEVRRQAASNESLINSYSEQFQIGERSLLDLLDTQRTRYSTQAALYTAESATRFAEYRVLAATGSLLKVMGVKANDAATAYAREQASVPPTPPAETQRRYSPDRTGNGLGPLY